MLRIEREKILTDCGKYTAVQRLVYRRGQAEKRFLDSNCQRNKEAVITLTYQIIDERFNLSDSHKPI